MTAQEIMQMGDEEILAFHSNLPPIKARRMDWRDFPVLQDRRRKPPLELPAFGGRGDAPFGANA
jgi:type IV secretory pathway TraG/TraD family ATPase VirD4